MSELPLLQGKCWRDSSDKAQPGQCCIFATLEVPNGRIWTHLGGMTGLFYKTNSCPVPKLGPLRGSCPETPIGLVPSAVEGMIQAFRANRFWALTLGNGYNPSKVAGEMALPPHLAEVLLFS